MKISIFFGLVFSFLFFGCKSELKEEGVLVFNLNEYSEKEKSVFLEMNLDENHPNLLDPNINVETFEEVSNSWKKLHSDLYQFLKKNNFDWDSNSKNIKVFNKIYFTSEGKIKVYAFRILSDISKEKNIEYEALIKEFTKSIRINIERDFNFAQCGKASFPNVKIKNQ
tara:strand:- start:44 stop:547 length:504 start_codon:yes stop_codon:yes gene_type:complete